MALLPFFSCCYNHLNTTSSQKKDHTYGTQDAYDNVVVIFPGNPSIRFLRWEGTQLLNEMGKRRELALAYLLDRWTQKGTSEKEKHVWDSIKVIKKPTKTETGINKYVCSTCLREKTEIIKKRKAQTTYTIIFFDNAEDMKKWYSCP